MRKIFLFFILAFFPSLQADEIATLETLIVTTKIQLERQQQALVLLKQFQQVRTAFIASSDDAKLGTQLVRVAMQLHQVIQESHLNQLFSKEFLEEIAFFNDVGETNRIKK